MLFKKLADQKEELRTYKEIKKRYEKLINRIIDKCEEYKGKQCYRNPNIGLNAVEELAKSDINEIYKLEDNLFLTDDD